MNHGSTCCWSGGGWEVTRSSGGGWSRRSAMARRSMSRCTATERMLRSWVEKSGLSSAWVSTAAPTMIFRRVSNLRSALFFEARRSSRCASSCCCRLVRSASFWSRDLRARGTGEALSREWRMTLRLRGKDVVAVARWALKWTMIPLFSNCGIAKCAAIRCSATSAAEMLALLAGPGLVAQDRMSGELGPLNPLWHVFPIPARRPDR
jgi:hypothetical protein